LGEQQPVDPGKHHIEVRRGEQLASADVQLARGETKVATLRFTQQSSAAALPSGEHPNRSAAPDAVTPPAINDVTSASTSRRTWGYAVAGAGAAGLVVGGVFGYLTLQAKQEQLDKCPRSSACPDRSGASSAHDSAITKGAVSTVAFIAGALATTAGIVLIATGKSAEREAQGPKLSLVTSMGPSTGNVRLYGEF
jgi:hypothetical protein